MWQPAKLAQFSALAEGILGAPFAWCDVRPGRVQLADASSRGGTLGGRFHVGEFALAKFQITNAQYQRFLHDPGGFGNASWWEYSPEALLWRRGHARPAPTAFAGGLLLRTRISWFDSMDFCAWLSGQLDGRIPLQMENPESWAVRLPSEKEWQRAALGDTGGPYPWGDGLDETRASYAKRLGRPAEVGSFPAGQSPFGIMDMVGNLFEWKLTRWGSDHTDPGGYGSRVIRGGAWNVSDPEYLRAVDRGTGWPPRGRLNDCGFRCALPYTSQ